MQVAEMMMNVLNLLFTGLFVGALIRYAASKTTTTHLEVAPNVTSTTYNQSLPPDTLWLTVIEYLFYFSVHFVNIVSYSPIIIKCLLFIFFVDASLILSPPHSICDINIIGHLHNDNVTYVSVK